MGQVLAEIFRHNRWATVELLKFCQGVDDAVLDTPLDGLYGTPRELLVHLVSAERRYSGRLHDLATAQVDEDQDFPGWDALVASAQDTGQILTELADRVDQDWTIEAAWQGKEWEMDGSMQLIQAIDHATEHRTQVRDALTRHGLEPPELDGWSYNEPRPLTA
jgi:uncharacterized damage-inducible protein DinB